MYISEFVEVDRENKAVRFFSNDWIEVDDIDAWIAAFWDAARDVAFEIGGDASHIERIAFNKVT